jgi:hypothetical protein
MSRTPGPAYGSADGEDEEAAMDGSGSERFDTVIVGAGRRACPPATT